MPRVKGRAARGPAQPSDSASAAFDADGSVASYAWDLDADGQFDDGTTLSVTKSFATTGEHVIGLRVTDNQGAVSTAYRVLEVHAENRPPSILVSHNRGNSGQAARGA